MWLIIYPSVLLQVPGLPLPLRSPAADTECPAPGSFLSPVPLSLFLFSQTALSGTKGVNTPRGSLQGGWGEPPRPLRMVSLWISSRTALPPAPADDPVINLSSVYSLPCLTFPFISCGCWDQLWILPHPSPCLRSGEPKVSQLGYMHKWICTIKN